MTLSAYYHNAEQMKKKYEHDPNSATWTDVYSALDELIAYLYEGRMYAKAVEAGDVLLGLTRQVPVSQAA